MKRFAIFVAVGLLLFTGEARAEEGDGWFQGHRGFTTKVSVGGAFRALYSVPIGAVDIALAPGIQTRTGGWYGVVGLLFGQTEYGLGTSQLRLGASWEAPVGRARLGLTPRASAIMVRRETYDDTLQAWALGAAAFASYDLITERGYAIYGAIEAGADFFKGSGTTPPVFVGGTLVVGARFFTSPATEAAARPILIAQSASRAPRPGSAAAGRTP